MFRFLIWWIFFSVGLLGCCLGYFEGYLDILWAVDQTRICFGIIAVFIYSSLRALWLLYKGKIDEDSGDHYTTSMVIMGMIGTSVGMILTLIGAGEIGLGYETKDELFAAVTSGFYISLITTVFGMVLGLVNTQQYRWLGKGK